MIIWFYSTRWRPLVVLSWELTLFVIFVPARHSYMHTNKLSENSFFRHFILRLPWSFIIGLSDQKISSLTIIVQILIQEFMDQPRYSFEIHVMSPSEADLGYIRDILDGRGASSTFSAVIASSTSSEGMNTVWWFWSKSKKCPSTTVHAQAWVSK